MEICLAAFGFHVALSCIPGQQCCSGRLALRECCTRGNSVLLGSSAMVAALLTGLAQVLWQPPGLESFCVCGVAAVGASVLTLLPGSLVKSQCVKTEDH